MMKKKRLIITPVRVETDFKLRRRGPSRSGAAAAPTYPLLENRPAPLQTGVEGEYMLALKRDLVEFLRDSPAFVVPAAAKADIERYSDRYQAALANRGAGELHMDWARLPQELRPAAGKRRRTSPSAAASKRAKKTVDISNRLDELEKKEEQQSDGEAEGAEDEEEDKEAEGEGEDLEEEDLDEEMDEGTDYINNYFDNGESYLDEDDDNLDDGPVY
ncbi:hypothetical protein ANN_03832 [Periplaneta americana]|uniref:DNA-directed RNA polymerase III subunit n=1 Tax=Periplaneta americana TaxID=6978 RepID=A0ABQ8U407_PERAM|nr:hypothetical protein ANN_03832 [Periplaneta americana]